MKDGELVEAARAADWQQVVLNGGPPCFHLEDGRFCLRAERWEGHGSVHAYVPLDGLLALARGEALEDAARIAETWPLKEWEDQYKDEIATAFRALAENGG